MFYYIIRLYILLLFNIIKDRLMKQSDNLAFILNNSSTVNSLQQ